MTGDRSHTRADTWVGPYGGEVALEIHDAGLVAVGWPDDLERDRPPETIGAPSPGYAFWQGHGDAPLLTGLEARERSQLAPRRAHHRFWHALDAHTPLLRPFPRGWTAADLAHAHLRSVRAALVDQLGGRGDALGTQGVVLAVPGSFDPEQLGLLLGVAAAAELPVRGLVDLGLAAGAALAETTMAETTLTETAGGPWQRALHLDLHLHRTVVTELAITGDEVARRAVELVDVGRLALEDAWARHLAAAFVRATRFDPFHAAETEQALYERLPAWLRALSEAEQDGGATVFALHLGGEKRSVEISRDEAAAAVGGLYRRITEPLRTLAAGSTDGETRPTVLLLSPTATALPGLSERLAELGFASVLPVPTGAAGCRALRAAHPAGPTVSGATGTPDALPLVLRLPLEARSLHGAA